MKEIINLNLTLTYLILLIMKTINLAVGEPMPLPLWASSTQGYMADWYWIQNESNSRDIIPHNNATAPDALTANLI